MNECKHYSHLGENEMIDIYEMHRVGKSLREIGRFVRRSKSTVSECLRWRPKKPVKSWMYLNSVEKAEYQHRGRLK